MESNLLNNFSEIVIEKPADKIIKQIRELISSGQLKPGDKLPSERMLSERFGIGRTSVRDAIRKLEFYGILKTLPQSGTVVAGLGIVALNGLIADVLKLEKRDFRSLVETRVILEVSGAESAAERRTDEDVLKLSNALKAYKKAVSDGRAAVEEDLLFHLKIAEASQNSVLNSLMLIIAPEIMYYFTEHNICGEGRAEVALEQHEIILGHIIDQNVDEVGLAMQDHLSDISEYVKTIKRETFSNGNDINSDL
ncbi:MAG: FadR/GntR family transcriptional regulator [Bacteroidota bacterium]